MPLIAILALLPAARSSAEKVEILRDEFGVPHIFAQTAAGAAFGSGYAQAADRAQQLLSNLHSGRPVSPASVLSAQVRAIVEAYCAGVNAYLTENHRSSARIDPSMVEAFSRSAFGQTGEANHVLLAPSRSRDGAVIAILDPLADWYGPSSLYALQVNALEGGLSFSGAAPPGVPFPLMGHNDSIVISESGAGDADQGALDQAWAMITSRNLDQAKEALALGQFPSQTFLIGTSGGEIYDSRSGIANPPDGVLLSGGGDPSTAAITRQLIGSANTFSLESARSLAFSTEVYKAESWQLRIAKAAPASEFAQMITGWSRRADASSRPALAFYLFKMALEGDSEALEPPDSLSDARIRAALRKAQDQIETGFPYDAGYGTLFRAGREDGRQSWPVGGGTVPEAGMFTPRPITFEQRGSVRMGRAGQAMVQVVVLSRPVKSVMALPLGETDSPDSPHFDDQARELFGKSQTKPTYFGDRRELEKHVKERKVLIFPSQ